MNRHAAVLWSEAIGSSGTVIRYGHWGRPVLVFPSEQGQAGDFEQVANFLFASAVKNRRGHGNAIAKAVGELQQFGVFERR